jgi:hypothetical protein
MFPNLQLEQQEATRLRIANESAECAPPYLNIAVLLTSSRNVECGGTRVLDPQAPWRQRLASTRRESSR